MTELHPLINFDKFPIFGIMVAIGFLSSATLYIYNSTTKELTRITSSTTPRLSQVTIVSKVGDTKRQTTVTNNSGSTIDIALIIFHKF